MTASVVIVTYRRLARLGMILEAWLRETPDVWLCDCSQGGFDASGLPVKIVRAQPDPGNRIRHAVALMTAGDLVIKADDDFLPRPGLVRDFCAWQARVGPAILGIHGRTFQGPGYYSQTTLYGGKEVLAVGTGHPQPVDFVGVCTASPRQYLAMDLRECLTEVEDLYWQMDCYPKAPKYVIPSVAFQNLEEAKDAGRLCADPASRKVRVDYFAAAYARWSVR